jgi:hypothetical protein
MHALYTLCAVLVFLLVCLVCHIFNTHNSVCFKQVLHFEWSMETSCWWNSECRGHWQCHVRRFGYALCFPGTPRDCPSQCWRYEGMVFCTLPTIPYQLTPTQPVVCAYLVEAKAVKLMNTTRVCEIVASTVVYLNSVVFWAVMQHRLVSHWFRTTLTVPYSRPWTSWPLKMGLLLSPEMSMRKQSTLCNIPKDDRIHCKGTVTSPCPLAESSLLTYFPSWRIKACGQGHHALCAIPPIQTFQWVDCSTFVK